MKLNRIQAANFLRLDLIDLSLPAPVTVIAGPNEAGKSSLYEAVRFALLGETLRVAKKGDYKLMVRDGAKAGWVAVDLGGQTIKREVKTGALVNDTGWDGGPVYLPYLLNSQKFGELKGKERRAIIMELTGTKLTTADIRRRLAAHDVPPGQIEEILPLLKNGFDAAHTHAQGRASDYRSQWVGLTGNARYGSQIAENWRFQTPQGYDEEKHRSLELQNQAIQGSIDADNVKKGGIVAELDRLQKLVDAETAGAQAGSADIGKRLDTALKRYDTLLIRKDALASERITLNQQLAAAHEKVPVECCHCGGMLRVQFLNQPGKGTIADVRPYEPVSEDALSALRQRHLQVSNDEGATQRDLAALESEISVLRAQEATVLGGSEPVDRTKIAALTRSLKNLDADLAVHTAERDDIGDQLSALRTAAARIRDAEVTEKRALDMHRSVQAWETAVAALAPDGIPAEILSDTLWPMNDRLRQTALVTGWPQVQLSPEMEILADGRPFGLLSESAQWRANAAISEAIAHLSDLRFLILDRADVLDLPNRAALVRWLGALSGDYDTVLVFLTAKAKPNLPAGMDSYWIESGRIDDIEPQEGAA